MNSVEHRLQLLERELRRSKLINRTLAIAFVSIICFAGANASDNLKSEADDQSTKQPGREPPSVPGTVKDKIPRKKDRLRTIKAEQFVVVDDQGQERGIFSMSATGPMIRMLDAKKRKTVQIGGTNTGIGVQLYDTNGVAIAAFERPQHKNVAHLGFQTKQGRSQIRASGISVFDAEDRQRLLLALINGNFPTVGVSDGNRDGPPSIEIRPFGLKIHNSTGFPVCSIIRSERDRVFLSMKHPDHERSVQITSKPKGEPGPTIGFFGPSNSDGSGGMLPRLHLGFNHNQEPYLRATERDGTASFAFPN